MSTIKCAHKLLIAAIAVSTVLTSAACTRKSKGKAPFQTSTQTAPQPAAPAPAPPLGDDELNKGSSKSAQQTPTLSDDDIKVDGTPISDEPQTTETTSGPAVGVSPTVVHYDPSGLTPEEIFENSERQGQTVRGEESEIPGLFYSGSGQDDVRERILAFLNQASHAKRSRYDQSFARTIHQITFDADFATRNAQIKVLIRSNGQEKLIDVVRPLPNDLIIRTGSLRSGNKIAIEAACMDLNGGCQTVYMKIQDGSQARVRTAHAIVRTTPASMFTQGQGAWNAENSEYDSFLNILLNTDNPSLYNNKVNALTLRTTEVMQGTSNVIVQMGMTTSRLGQTDLNFSGPLTKQAHSNSTSSPMKILRSTSPIAQTIREVQLIKNDGRGNIQVAITIRKDSARADEDSVILTFGRAHKPALPLRLK